MLVLQQTTIVFEDQTTQSNGPLLEIKDVNLTVINDPLLTLTFEGNGISDVAGPLHVSGKIQRDTLEVALDLEALTIPLGPALMQRVAVIAPEAAAQVADLHGQGLLKLSLANRPANSQPFTYEATLALSKADFSHPRLPWPLQDIEASARVINGRHSPASRSRRTRSGPTRFELTIKDLNLSREYNVKDRRLAALRDDPRDGFAHRAPACKRQAVHLYAG